KGLNAKTKAHIFEDMRAEKLIQTTGKDRDEIDLSNYGHVVLGFQDEEKKAYDSKAHQQHYAWKVRSEKEEAGEQNSDSPLKSEYVLD
ncbi:MAG: hypothetical protein K940chlam7_01725, partial [Chlamydiae bacterium]|nr:hypothetical protein [Chlamydiota bacterium]